MKLDTVEDAVEVIADELHSSSFRAVLGDPWFSRFFSNVVSWVRQGKPLTTEQAKIVLKAFTKVRFHLIALGADRYDVAALLDNPRYRHTPTLSSTMPREVRYLGDGVLGFRFKRNDVIIDDIKEMRAQSTMAPHRVEWQPGHRMWTIGIMDSTLAGIMTLIMKHRFQFDDDVAAILADAHDAHRGISTFTLDADGMMTVKVMDNDVVASWVQGVLGGVPQ